MRRLQVPPSQYQFHTSRRSVAAEAHLVVLTFLIVSCVAASAAPVGERACKPVARPAGRRQCCPRGSIKMSYYRP